MEIIQIQRAAEVASKFVRGQIVVAIFPTVRLITRVVGWDEKGGTLVGLPIQPQGDPHHCQREWSEELLRPQNDEDWAVSSEYHAKWKEGVEVKILFTSEPSGFGAMKAQECQAILVSPHIRKGDWVIQYGPDKRFRVLNEGEMLSS